MLFRRPVLYLAAAAICAAAGCSEIEPKTGTRVVFEIVEKTPTREETAQVSRYLVRRSSDVLGADRARVDSVDGNHIVLLLPGVYVGPDRVSRLLDAASIEFYHLRRVATKRHPDRPWKLMAPEPGRASYLFSGPDAQLIDSLKEPEELLRKVVGFPHEKPVLTGDHVLPTARYQSTDDGIAVLVEFDEEGAKIFHEFTRANPGEHLAVFYNGRLVSAPAVSQPISGGRASITGFRTLAEARSAVARLNTGKLPLKLRIESVSRY